MEQKLINSNEDYKKYLDEVERLVALDPEVGTAEAERLSLLAFFLEAYEKKHFFVESPDPISAIKHRMEEQDLQQADLVPYIGSKSKVSEVLSGKRSLSISMIRALSTGLGIPSNVLIGKNDPPGDSEDDGIDYKLFPIKEMIRRGWIKVSFAEAKQNLDRVVQDFIQASGGMTPASIRWRRSVHKRLGSSIDRHSLLAWTIRVQQLASKIDVPAYKPGTVTLDFMRDLARLSTFKDGPLLARELLAKNGIILILEPHLPGTSLDGGALLSTKGNPIVALTIRHDRLDAFWYNLMHELAHVSKHLLAGEQQTFLDDLERDPENDPQEKEADRLCKEALVPRSVWRRSTAFRQRSAAAIIQTANELKISPAIIAGMLRHESGNYAQFTDMIGLGEVKKLFTDVQWSF